MTQRAKVLLAALGVALLFVVWSKLGDDTPAPARRRASAAAADAADGVSRRRAAPSRAGRTAEEGPVTEIVELRLEALEPRPAEYGVSRNPFAFYVPPPPPPPPKPKGPTPEELAAQRAALEAARQAAIEAAAVPAKPRPPAITVKYLGSFGPPSRKIAVFSNGESIYNALQGDVLEGKFRLVSIGYESVELAFVDFPEIPPEQLPVGPEGS